MPKVSVIIPVYNTEKYLRECLDSIIGQTLEDIEILCIDDCSTDSSLQVLQEYAQKDIRVKVFQNSVNQGLSYTRNVGIDNACGEYIQFVDSDDQIELDTLETLYHIAAGNQLDLLKFLWSGQKKDLFHESFANHVFPSGQEMLIQIVFQIFSCTGVWVLFLNRKFMLEKNVRFVPEMRYTEDTLFTFQAISLAQRCMCVNERKYINRIRENSLTTSPLTDDKIFWYMFLIQEIIESNYANPDSPSYRQAKFAYLDKTYSMAMREINRRLSVPDVSAWEPKYQQLYHILFSGRGWTENLIDREKLSENQEAISSASHIYIFGAGNAAQCLIQLLYQVGIGIDGVIVSDTSKNRKTVYGYQVFSVNEISTEEGQPLILAAVTGTHDEIGALLKEHGLYNVVNVCP